jgi:hypothetical protein
MKKLGWSLLSLWLGWFALAGLITAGLAAWLTPWNPSMIALVAIGAGLGLAAGVLLAAFLAFVLYRRFGKPLLQLIAFIQFFRKQLAR